MQLIYKTEIYATGFQVGPALQKVARVTLTAAQLQGMHATPVSVVPAPGTGKVIVVDKVIFQSVPGTTAFTGGGTINLEYHGTSTAPHSGTVPATALTVGTADVQYLGPVTSGAVDLESLINVGLDITNGTAAFAAGNGSAVVIVSYAVVTLG